MTTDQRCTFDFCDHDRARHIKDDVGDGWWCMDCRIHGGIAQNPAHQFTAPPKVEGGRAALLDQQKEQG